MNKHMGTKEGTSLQRKATAREAFAALCEMFRWVLIGGHPEVQSAERNPTRNDAELQDRGAPSILEEVRSDAEV